MAKHLQLSRRTVAVVRIRDGANLPATASAVHHRNAGGEPRQDGLYLEFRDGDGVSRVSYFGPIADPVLARMLRDSAIYFGATMPSPRRHDPWRMPNAHRYSHAVAFVNGDSA